MFRRGKAGTLKRDLFDTHVDVWAGTNDASLPVPAAKLIDDAARGDALVLSAIIAMVVMEIRRIALSSQRRLCVALVWLRAIGGFWRMRRVIGSYWCWSVRGA
jgi:hypothetical protein